MQFKNGWMAIAAFAASAMALNARAAENECLTVTSNTTLNANATYGNLVVNSGVTLTIAAGVVLSLDGISDTCSNYIHQIDGSVVLNGSGAVLKFIDTSQIVQGVGDIDGQNNAAKIEIDSGLRLRNHLLIQGHLQIDRAGSGTATFENYANSTAIGIVSANATGGSSGSPKILELSANLILDDTTVGGYRPTYEAVGDGYSRLKFSRACDGSDANHPVLEGNFALANCADMLINQDVVTNGGLTHISGTVVVATGKSLCWNAGSNCYSAGNNNAGSCSTNP